MASKVVKVQFVTQSGVTVQVFVRRTLRDMTLTLNGVAYPLRYRDALKIGTALRYAAGKLGDDIDD